MIPAHKRRVSISVDAALLRQIDDAVQGIRVHRSTLLSAAVHAAVQNGLLLLSKPGIKDLAEGVTVPLHGRGGFQSKLTDVRADSRDDELAALRAENAKLKGQLAAANKTPSYLAAFNRGRV